jgi:putative ATP-dependent endonuclease of the OLD family
VHITNVVVENYRLLRRCTTTLNEKLNILVGNNECGKSTLIEAIHLTLSGQLNGRPLATELHPHLFNQGAVQEYIEALQEGKPAPLPTILVELYFADQPALSKLKGHNNSRRENVPGVKLTIEFNEDYKAEYEIYVAEPKIVRTIPVEYYVFRFRDFADNDVTPRSIPIKTSLIDASTIRNNAAASRYVIDIVKDTLSRKDQVDLALSYRLMRDRFLGEEKVEALNAELSKKKGSISNKTLSISLDTSSRTSWETGVMPQLDEIPMTLIGKGEQNSVKIKLALETSAESHFVLIEEPENHLSHSNLNALIEHISTNRGGRQLLMTTHSSYVLNKLPGHDTLRLILAERTILVEGPSDELIVQAAFRRKHTKLPLEAGVDVISVRSLAFKRFLEIAVLLNLRTDVVTDNDGDIEKLKKKYDGYLEKERINIRYDDDVKYKTLEPQLLKANGVAVVNDILGTVYKTEGELLDYMEANKTETALRFFETDKPWSIPKYIEAAIG